MNQHIFTSFLVLVLFFSALDAKTKGRNKVFDAETSLVEIEVTRKTYNYKIPWIVGNTQTRKNGIVISGDRILTTADGLSGQYLCRVRKGGESRQYVAKIRWIDYHSNIALIDVTEPDFWEGMRSVKLATKLPLTGDLQVYRWRSGRIESRAAEIIRLYVGKSKTSYVRHLCLSVSSEINAAGWAEVVIHEGKLIGLTSSGSDKRLAILPSPFIDFVLQGSEQMKTPGAAFFDFDWMEGKNPDLLRSKGFNIPGLGVVICEIGKRGLSKNTLRTGDILYEIDGFSIDNDGKYIDPDYGRLSMNGLATRSRFAGETIPMRVWRDGSGIDVNYLLPRADFEKSIIPEQSYDRAPEYIVAGGLVFQPLTGELLRSLGQNKPLLLDYYEEKPPVGQREGLVLLTMVLPDEYNRGYESASLLLVDEINGQPIHSLQDVTEALGQSQDGYHQIRFMPDEAIIHMVLDAVELDSATSRILERYRIPKQSHIEDSQNAN